MKSADDWRIHILANDLKPEGQSDKMSLIDSVRAIQQDALHEAAQIVDIAVCETACMNAVCEARDAIHTLAKELEKHD